MKRNENKHSAFQLEYKELQKQQNATCKQMSQYDTVLK